MSADEPHLPVIELSCVYHIGTLNPADRGRPGRSLEAHMLSVSLDPEAWIRIARLGGNPIHALSLAQRPARFLDIHAVLDDPALSSTIEQWAVEKEYAYPGTLWRGWFFDDELDCHCCLIFPDEAAAREEFRDPEEDAAPAGHQAVEAFDTLLPTDKLREAIPLPFDHPGNLLQYLVILWAETHPTDLDGVWWAEMHDPEGLSAPRGGIFPGKVDTFRATEVDLDATPDFSPTP